MQEKDDYLEIDLLELCGALWHRAWAIILSILIAGGGEFSCAAFLVTPM